MKRIINFLGLLLIVACASSEETIDTNTLQATINKYEALQQDEVIACAASAKDDNNISYVFYYPIPGATNIQYYETIDTTVDKEDFDKYELKNLTQEPVFNGYLGRFVREVNHEAWGIVTYISEGKFHKSNPIRLKNSSKPTEWTAAVSISYPENLSPKFVWEDGVVKENVIYFQVVTDENNDLLSGTYTYDKYFQYYNLSNVVLNVTREIPPSLTANTLYNFTMMGVSEDNWVNLVVQKPFTTN